MLDAELAAALPPLVLRRAASRLVRDVDSPASPQRRAVPDHLFDGLIGSEDEEGSQDEDWAADVAREQKLASAERVAHLRHQRSHETDDAALRIGKRLSESEPGSEGGEQQQIDHPLCGSAQQQADPATPASAGPSRQQQTHGTPYRTPEAVTGPVTASPKAVAAVWELVQCCVGAAPMPPGPTSSKLPRPVGLRWYDARARVALLQVASWLQVRWGRAARSARTSQSRSTMFLQVPSLKVSNLELLLTHTDRAPRHKALSPVEEDAWARRMRFFKESAHEPRGGAEGVCVCVCARACVCLLGGRS